MKEITSTTNPIIKEVYKCKNKENYRKEKHWVLVEGSRQIKLALNRFDLLYLFYCPELSKDTSVNVDEDKIIQVDKKVFDKISFKNNPDAYLAVFKDKDKKLKDIKLSKNPLILVFDKVEKPGNLGALARTAVAANIDAIILTDQQVDAYNPKVVSSSTGHSLSIDIISCSKKEAIIYLQKNNIKIFATSIESSQNYLRTDFNNSCALIFGSEDLGLDEEWLNVADKRIIIPMLSEIDSLNVSVSAAIIIYEALRQRKVIDF
jgi:TrmH family RNA methyltransferase